MLSQIESEIFPVGARNADTAEPIGGFREHGDGHQPKIGGPELHRRAQIFMVARNFEQCGADRVFGEIRWQHVQYDTGVVFGLFDSQGEPIGFHLGRLITLQASLAECGGSIPVSAVGPGN